MSAMQLYDEVLMPRLFVPWARPLDARATAGGGGARRRLQAGLGDETCRERVAPSGRVTGSVVGDELADRCRAGPSGLPSADELGELIAAGLADARVEGRTVAVAFEGGAAQFTPTLAASGIAAEIEAIAPERQAELIRVFEARAAPLAADRATHSATVSNLVLVRR